MRAIISAANREGLEELARELVSNNVTIYSTSGTASFLRASHARASHQGILQVVEGAVGCAGCKIGYSLWLRRGLRNGR